MSRRFSLALAAALGSAFAAQAQTLPNLQNLPSGAEPRPEPPRPVMPQPGLQAPAIRVEGRPAAEAPAGAEALKFQLVDLRIEGATAFTPEQLAPLYAGLLGREISVAQAFGIAQQIELKYREAGFVTTRVLVPEQAVEGGRFRLVVVEGFIAALQFHGEIGAAREAVERLLRPLVGVKPVHIAEIERRLLLADDLQGLIVRAVLEPSATQFGGSDLIITAERKAVSASVSADNRASPYLGRTEVAASLDWNAIGARADQLSLNLRSSLPKTKRSQAVSAQYGALVSDSGAMLTLGATQARSRPGRELDVLDVRSRVASSQAGVSMPFIRSREQNLQAVAQFEWRDVDTDIGGQAFTRDRLRIGRIGFSYDRSDAWSGVTAARAMLHVGQGGAPVGAKLASRRYGRSDFSKLTLDLTRVQQLGERFSLLATATAQLTEEPMLASEEFTVGGRSFGRAYDEGEISGDRGAAVALELRYQATAGLQAYAYADHGRVSATPQGAAVPRATLSSLGGGLRLALPAGLNAALEVAKPLNTAVRTEGNKHARVFLTVGAQF